MESIQTYAGLTCVQGQREGRAWLERSTGQLWEGLVQADAVPRARPPCGGVCPGAPTVPIHHWEQLMGRDGGRMKIQEIPKAQPSQAGHRCPPQVGSLSQAGVSSAVLIAAEQAGKTAF